MKELCIDLETFSSVQVYDLACGEKVPDEILKALTDEKVIKHSYNASFERICLSRYLGLPAGTYLSPEGWRCDMVWAATLGLPQSLEGVGAVLGLEKQKLTEGKDLIRYFCKPCAPTLSNGGRTRNLPRHAPDKWETFKRYNLRDVETEMEIQKRLSKYPVPDFIWEEYIIDQEINDRGVLVDMELVRQAICMDARSREELITAMKEFTALENPNSVQQMKDWLAVNGLMTESLDKKAVGSRYGSSLPNPPSRNIRPCRMLYALITAPGDSSASTARTVPGGSAAKSCSFRIWQETACLILTRPGLLSVPGIMTRSPCSMRMCLIHCLSSCARPLSRQRESSFMWRTFQPLKPG